MFPEKRLITHWLPLPAVFLLCVIAGASGRTSNKAAALGVFRRLPQSFERNMGQSATAVRYLSRGPGYSVLFRENEADFLLIKRAAASSPDGKPLPAYRGLREVGPVAGVDLLHMHFDGSRAGSELDGLHRLPGIVNYLTGDDPAHWHTRIPTFSEVQYEGLYPGIDLLYYGNAGRLEFDFRLSPGASPALVRFHFTGQKAMSLNRNGSLNVFVSHGSVTFDKPVIYQPGPANTRLPVQGGFRLDRDGTVGFEIGRFDRTRPLIIDPILDYSSYLGTVSAATSIAVDPAGEAFVAGYAEGGLPTTSGSYQPNFPSGGKSDPTPVGDSLYTNTAAFVAKLNSTGTALLYCTYLSGSQNDVADAIAVDASGNAYVAGATASPDFPVTPGAFQTANNASRDGTGFITELNSSGSGLVYSTFLGGSEGASITGLALDSSGDVFVTGYTSDLDFPVTPGAFQPASPVDPIVGGKGFVTKLAPGGKKLLYSTYIGGSKWDLPYGIAVDANGDAYIAGGTQSSDFPITSGAFQTVNKATIFNLLGGSFVSKLNPTGTALVYSTYLDGSATDVAYAIAVDSSGNAYVTGFATSPDFPTTPGVVQPSLGLSTTQTALLEMSNVFVTKLNPSGSDLVYSTFLGGSQTLNPGAYGDTGLSIAVDGAGDAYVTGSTEDTDFPVTPGALQTQNIAQEVSGDLASFVTKLNPTASQILYSTYLTGTGDQSGDPAGISCDCAMGIALDSSQNAYVVGRTVSTDFPTTLGAIQNQSEYGISAFIAKLDNAEMQQLPLSTTTVTASQNPQIDGQPITFTATIKSSSGDTPSGTVGFSYQGLLANGTPYAFGPWNNVAVDSSGTAEFTTSSLPSGSIGVVAYYLGDSADSPSLGSMTETVNQIPTTTTITANTASAPYGTPITFTATVVETASGEPAQGSVYFLLGSTSFEYTALDSAGQATWTSGAGGLALPAGSDTITASFYTPEGAPDQVSKGAVTVSVTPVGTAEAPAFSPAGGTYSTPQDVALSSATAGAIIYYTTDGSTPTTASSPYQSGLPIEVTTSETIQAIAIAPGYSSSSVASANYVISSVPPDFAISANPASLSANIGQSVSTTISVTPSNGFSQNVSFSCSGQPAGSSCTFSPSTVSGSGSTTLTIAAPASIALNQRNSGPIRAPIFALTFLLGWIPFRRRQKWMILTLFGTLAVGLFGLTGCGGSSAGSGPISQSYSITVQATSGALSHTLAVDLTVTQP